MVQIFKNSIYMRKASVHTRSGPSEECSATTLPHATLCYASEPRPNTHTHTRTHTQTQTKGVAGCRVHALRPVCVCKCVCVCVRHVRSQGAGSETSVCLCVCTLCACVYRRKSKKKKNRDPHKGSVFIVTHCLEYRRQKCVHTLAYLCLLYANSNIPNICHCHCKMSLSFVAGVLQRIESMQNVYTAAF